MNFPQQVLVWRRIALVLYLASIPATGLTAYAYGSMVQEAEILQKVQSQFSIAVESADNEIRGRQ